MLVKVSHHGVSRIVETSPPPTPPPDPPTPIPSVLPDLPTRQIIETVSEYFGVPPWELLGIGRTARIAQARQVGMYLTRRLTGNSYLLITKMFGRENRTTAFSACRAAAEAIEADPQLAAKVKWLEGKLRSEADTDARMK
jgi:hypothetical protein